MCFILKKLKNYTHLKCGVSTINTDKKSMKRIFMVIALAMSGLYVFAGSVVSNTVLNGGFESWSSETIVNPENYSFTADADNAGKALSSGETFEKTVIKSTDAYHGTYALQLTTQSVGGETQFGYALNANPDADDPAQWYGGIPISEAPTGFTCFYKCDIATGDSALVLISFSKAGSSIGFFAEKIGGTKSTYTKLDFDFPTPLLLTPDSVIVGFASSNAFGSGATVGSTITIDSVAFKGVTAQPADLLGDFETWEDVTINIPDNWLVDGGSLLYGMEKTTDAYEGSSAVKLTTDSRTKSNGNAVAEAGRLQQDIIPIIVEITV